MTEYFIENLLYNGYDNDYIIFRPCLFLYTLTDSSTIMYECFTWLLTLSTKKNTAFYV